MTDRAPERRRTRASPRPSRPRDRTTPLPSSPAPRAADPGAEPRVTLAAVTGAHGIGGEVRLKLFTDDLAAFPTLDAAGRRLSLVALRPGPNGAVASFAEIGDRTAAESLRGVALTVPRSELPPLGDDEYYHADLIGLPCEAGGEPVGHAVAVENFGAGDIVEIERPDGRRFMVPIATAVTIERERLLVDPDFVT